MSKDKARADSEGHGVVARTGSDKEAGQSPEEYLERWAAMRAAAVGWSCFVRRGILIFLLLLLRAGTV